MFFFFNYKHYPAVVTTVAGHAGSSANDSADYVREVIQYTKKKRRKTYTPEPAWRRYPTKQVPVTVVETKATFVETPSLSPKVRKALTYVDNPIEYTPYTLPEIPLEELPKVLEVTYTPPKKEAVQKKYSKIEIVKPDQDSKAFLKLIEKAIAEEYDYRRLEEAKEYLKKQAEKERLEKEQSDQEDFGVALLAAGEEDLAALLLSL